MKRRETWAQVVTLPPCSEKPQEEMRKTTTRKQWLLQKEISCSVRCPPGISTLKNSMKAFLSGQHCFTWLPAASARESHQRSTVIGPLEPDRQEGCPIGFGSLHYMDSRGKSKGFGRCSNWLAASKKSWEEQNAVAIGNEWQPRRWDVVLMQNKGRHKRMKMKSQSERRHKRKENRIRLVKQLRPCVHPRQTSSFLLHSTPISTLEWRVQFAGQENQLKGGGKGKTQGSGCVHTAHITCLWRGGGFFNLSMQ